MGAILPPMQTPPICLLGTPVTGWPKYHRTLFAADFLEEPVPTTSPTKATGNPLDLTASTCAMGPTFPCSSGSSPSRVILYMARACKGISGRDQASGAGDRSSVLVSPVTLKTTIFKDLGSSSRLVNHSASAQDCITDCAFTLPSLAIAATS